MDASGGGSNSTDPPSYTYVVYENGTKKTFIKEVVVNGSQSGEGFLSADGGRPTYTPPPDNLPGFPGAERIKPKGGRPRWRLPGGDIGEWDGQHGEVERYNPRGKHKGVWSPDGRQIKEPVPGRTIDPFTPETYNWNNPANSWYIVGTV